MITTEVRPDTQQNQTLETRPGVPSVVSSGQEGENPLNLVFAILVPQVGDGHGRQAVLGPGSQPGSCTCISHCVCATDTCHTWFIFCC